MVTDREMPSDQMHAGRQAQGKHRASTRQAQELSAAIGAPFGVRDRDVATERVAHEDHLLDAHGHTPCLESVHEEGLGLLHAALDAVPEVPARSAREAAAEGIDGVHLARPALGQPWQGRVVGPEAPGKAMHAHERQRVGRFAHRLETVLDSVNVQPGADGRVSGGEGDLGLWFLARQAAVPLHAGAKYVVLGTDES